MPTTLTSRADRIAGPHRPADDLDVVDAATRREFLLSRQSTEQSTSRVALVETTDI